MSQLAESNLRVRRGGFEVLNLLQVVAVSTGLVLFGLFVLTNVGAGPRIEIERAVLTADNSQVAVSLDCRSGAGTGCQGEVVLLSAGKQPGELGHALFSQKQDGPEEARVRLRPKAHRNLRAKTQVVVMARASGRFGNSAATERVVTLARERGG